MGSWTQGVALGWIGAPFQGLRDRLHRVAQVLFWVAVLSGGVHFLYWLNQPVLLPPPDAPGL